MTQAVAQWRPTLRVFLRRTGIIGLLTLFAFAVPSLLVGVRQMALLLVPLILALYFVFDDVQKWRLARNDRWALTPDTLIHTGFEGETRIPLAEIDSAKSRFGWSVIVKLSTGMRVEMPYLGQPKMIAIQILSTRNAMNS